MRFPAWYSRKGRIREVSRVFEDYIVNKTRYVLFDMVTWATESICRFCRVKNKMVKMLQMPK